MSSFIVRRESKIERERIFRCLEDESSQNRCLFLDGILTLRDFRAVISRVTDQFATIEIIESHLDDAHGGLLIAELVTSSTQLITLSLDSNHITESTVYALARAFIVNKSVVNLCVSQDSCASLDVIRSAFFTALRLNPLRNPESRWVFCNNDLPDYSDVYTEMKQQVDQLGHPSLLFILAHHDCSRLHTWLRQNPSE